MSRTLACALVIVFIGCQSPEKAAIQPLPADAAALNYSELVIRARSQVGAAHEFFYTDKWLDVELAADALQDTAVRLSKLKPEAVPIKQREKLAQHVEELTKAAADLRAAAKAKDETKTTDAFQKLHLKVRELRPD